MNVIKLKNYGCVLIERGLGQEVKKSISKEIKYPVAPDFEDIKVMGSGFGEELYEFYR
jgi:hypothetical protein